ncbi:hypothetical protein [Bacillus mycoides]|uniref:hypothetical protein n=1 Tax=Bacillus mycoides TaxID=1405 RepID=UPI003CF9EF0D
MNYYKYLKGREDVAHVECHPSYTLVPSFEIKSSITKSGKSKKAAMKFNTGLLCNVLRWTCRGCGC